MAPVSTIQSEEFKSDIKLELKKTKTTMKLLFMLNYNVRNRWYSSTFENVISQKCWHRWTIFVDSFQNCKEKKLKTSA